MCRCLTRVCAGVLLLALTGCTVDSFLASHICVDGPQRLVNGTVGDVAARLQDGLTEAGIIPIVKRVKDEIRVGGVFQKRMAFVLHLRQQKVKGSLQTVVRMQWDYGGDVELWQLIQRILSRANEATDNADEATASGG